MRTQIRRQRLESGDLWRVCEADGLPVSRWLPTGPFLGCLDKGGFELLEDARSFSLGVDLVRAESGFLGDLDAHAIDIERAELDGGKPGHVPTGPMFEAA